MKIPKMEVKLGLYGDIKVPKVTVGIKGQPVNTDRLRHYGELLRTAQNALDRMPTSDNMNLCPAEVELGFNLPLMNCSAEEAQLFEEMQRLNAEVVLRVLVMRRLVTAGLTGV